MPQTNAVTMPPIAVFDGASAGGSPEPDQWVTRRGKIFAVGAYPDKDFDLTVGEMAAAVAGFTPVPIELEHFDTDGREHVLSGKTGELSSVELSDDGQTLLGVTRWPKWLDIVVPPEQRKVSTVWNRTTKRLERLGLVLKPRVEDAVLMSYASFAGKRHSTSDIQDIQAIHDTAVKQGALCADPARMSTRVSGPGEKGDKMKATDFLAGLFHAAREEGIITDATFSDTHPAGETVQGAPTSVPAQATAGVPAQATAGVPATDASHSVQQAAFAQVRAAEDKATRLERELAEQRVTFAAAQAARFQAEAVTFATTQIAAQKALPAEREPLIALCGLLASDDAAHGAVTFAEGKTASRLEMLTALFAARPDADLTGEKMPADQDASALFNQQETSRAGAEKPMTKERRLELLGKTQIGQSVAPTVAAG